ncbi:hypothetical protein B0O99DRAFT_656491 [Bisporella sp. PMI_857]|nr:hypothetical protein B0O99DRAFT_656491 [Bisporella sp. PMI_857]
MSSVIVVPGIGTASPGAWFEGKGQTWDHFLPHDVLPSPSVYYFHHGLGPDIDSQLWINILDRGLGLLEDLLVLLNTRDECLTIALERTTDFKDVVRATAAFIAIATPHSKSDEPKEWNQLQLLVGTRGYHKRGNPTSVDDAKRLANLSTIAVSDSRKYPLANLSDFSTTKRDPTLPCHMIASSRNRDFYGRWDVLAMIDEFLAPVDQLGAVKKDLKTFALCGPGGMGKTQVANEYAITHMDMYEAIFWVHAEEATTLADEFSRLADGLGLVLEGTADARDQVVTRELVKGWLANPVRSYNRADIKSDNEVAWLLIFDNVRSADLLSEFWPPTGSSGSILITSRDTLAKTPFYQIKDGIDLPPLSNKDSAELLLKLTWRENNSEEEGLSSLVADKLGGMPLALTQMAGVMIRQSLSFADFLNRYEEEETHGTLFSLSLEPSHKRTNYGYTLASGLLDIMAFLDPDGIPEKYLVGVVGEVQLPDYPKTVTAYQDARSELLKSSLIRNDRSASNLTIHRLIQDGARAKMQPDRATIVFSAAVEVLWSMWPPAESGVRHHVARWKDCELLAPHILRLKEHYLRAGRALKSRWINNLNFATLLNELGCTKQHQELSPISTTQDEGRGYFLLAETHNNIAGAATEYNDADTALHHFKVYNNMLQDKQRGKINVADSRLTSSFFNLGMSYTMMGDYENATTNFKQALEEAEKLPDPKNSKLARSLALTNLGLTKWLMEDQTEAAKLLERALKEREELLGPNDRQSMITGRILHCLGNVRRSQGLLQEGLEFHKRALLHFKETVGKNHHRTGNSCFKVAEHYSRIGKLPEAVELLDQALKIFDRHLCYTPEKGRVAFLKSIVLEQLGESETSKACLDQAYSLYQQSSRSTNKKIDLVLKDFDRYVHVWGR